MVIKLAEKIFRINNTYKYIENYCADYLVSKDTEAVDYVIDIAHEDIEKERALYQTIDEEEKRKIGEPSDGYLETLAAYRAIAEVLIDDNVLLAHGSAISVDGEGFLFIAKSGVGKSTHTRLWRECFGKRSFMINDDKPLLIVKDDSVFVCGTPWNGKHRLDTDCIVPLKAICMLRRGKNNAIRKISSHEAIDALFQQIYRPVGAEKMVRTLQLLRSITRTVGFYCLECNTEPDAPIVSYNAMKEGL